MICLKPWPKLYFERNKILKMRMIMMIWVSLMWTVWEGWPRGRGGGHLGASHSKSLKYPFTKLKSKNYEDDRFLFLKIPSSSVFILALKFLQKSAKSCATIIILENHNICKNRLKYWNKNCKRAYLKNRLTIS